MRMLRRIFIVLVIVVSLATTWFLVLADEIIDPASPADASVNIGSLLYVGLNDDTTDTVATINPFTGALVTDPLSIMPSGGYPYDATLDQDNVNVWIAGAVGDGVVVVDGSGEFVIEPIVGFGEYPVDIAFSKLGDFAYVANRLSENIAVIDTATRNVVDDFDASGFGVTSSSPGKMAIHPCTGDIYMVDWFDDYLFQVDETTGALINEIDAGTSLWDVVVSPDGDTIYATDRSSSSGDHVIVVDTATFTVTNRISVGDDPWGIGITPDGSRLVTANEDDGTVSIIDTGTETVIETIELGTNVDPRDVDINAAGTLAYIPSGDEDDTDVVYVIDLGTNTLADTISLPELDDPNVIAITPDTFSLDPVSRFTSNSPVGNPSIAIIFMDTSLNNPTSWDWDFGDGLGTSTLQNPTYSYANPGTYTVTLTTTNACGSHTTTGVVQIGIKLYLPIINKP